MSNAQEIYNEIRDNLCRIKSHGGYIDQYDGRLFELFIESYREQYMDSSSTPRLTADAIVEKLMEDSKYNSTAKKVSYDLEDIFREKWQRWTEAFRKGFSGGYITWKNG